MGAVRSSLRHKSRKAGAALLFGVAVLGCGQSGEVEALEARLTDVEDRITQLESQGPQPSTSDQSPRVAAELGRGEDSAAAVDSSSVDQAESLDLLRMAEAAFESVPEFGVIDPEFGGIHIAGSADLLELQMSKNGFLHVDALRGLLTSLGFDGSDADMLVSGDRGEVTLSSADGIWTATSTQGEDELFLLISAIG